MEMDLSQEPVSRKANPSYPSYRRPAGQGPAVDPTSMSPEQKRAMIYLGIIIFYFLVFDRLTIYVLGFVAHAWTGDPHPRHFHHFHGIAIYC